MGPLRGPFQGQGRWRRLAGARQGLRCCRAVAQDAAEWVWSWSWLLVFLTFLYSLSLFLLAGEAEDATPHPRAMPRLPTLRSTCALVNCSDPASYKSDGVYAALKAFLSGPAVVTRTFDCAAYFDVVLGTFARDPVTTEEREFPIAFAHAVHNQVSLLEMQLALLFRPVDSHCIHVDRKASAMIRDTVQRIVRCYNQEERN